MEKKSKEESVRDLPSDSLYEILVRLPLKAIVRFKCICKEWISVIRDYSFAHGFIVRHAQDPMVLISFPRKNSSRNGSVFLSLDIQTGVATPIHNLNIPPFSRASDVVGTLDGIIFIELDGRIHRCNLSTGDIVPLPAAPPDFPLNQSAFRDPFGSLGFDAENKDYKVLKTWISLEGKPMSCHKIMNMRDRVWRDVDTGPIEVMLGGRTVLNHVLQFGGSVFVKGALHYLAADRSGTKKFIVAFDVALEKFSKISLPDKAASGGNLSSLALLRGHLVMLDPQFLRDEGVINLYELKDYETRSWEDQTLKLQQGWNEPLISGQLWGALHLTAIGTYHILITPSMVTHSVLDEQSFCVLLVGSRGVLVMERMRGNGKELGEGVLEERLCIALDL